MQDFNIDITSEASNTCVSVFLLCGFVKLIMVSDGIMISQKIIAM